MKLRTTAMSRFYTVERLWTARVKLKSRVSRHAADLEVPRTCSRRRIIVEDNSTKQDDQIVFTPSKRNHSNLCSSGGPNHPMAFWRTRQRSALTKFGTAVRNGSNHNKNKYTYYWRMTALNSNVMEIILHPLGMECYLWSDSLELAIFLLLKPFSGPTVGKYCNHTSPQ